MKNIRDAIGELLWFEVKTIGNEKADKIANTILTLLRGEMEARRKKRATPMSWESDYNAGIDDILALLK